MTSEELFELTGIEPIEQKIWMGELDNLSFYKNEWSWGEDLGVLGTLYRKATGERINLPYGGWYCDNERLNWYPDNKGFTSNKPYYSALLALLEKGAEPGDILIIREWSYFGDNSSHYSNAYYYILRPEDLKKAKSLKESLELEKFET